MGILWGTKYHWDDLTHKWLHHEFERLSWYDAGGLAKMRARRQKRYKLEPEFRRKAIDAVIQCQKENKEHYQQYQNEYYKRIRFAKRIYNDFVELGKAA